MNRFCTILALAAVACGSSTGDRADEPIGSRQQELSGLAELYPISDPHHDIGYNSWFVTNNSGDPNCADASHYGCVDDKNTDLGSHVWMAGSNGLYSHPEVYMVQGLKTVVGQTIYDKITSVSVVTISFYGQSHDGRSCIDVISEVPDKLYFDFTTGVATDNLHMPYTQRQNPAYGPLCWDAAGHNGTPSRKQWILSINPYTLASWKKAELAQPFELEMWTDLHTPTSSATAVNVDSVYLTVVYNRNP